MILFIYLGFFFGATFGYMICAILTAGRFTDLRSLANEAIRRLKIYENTAELEETLKIL